MRYNIPFLVLGAPIVVALIWGFLAYQVIILGRFVQFSVFIMPFSIILLVIYLMGMIFWYKIESTGYRRKIQELEMDMNSLLSRIEMAESSLREIRDKGK